MTTIKRICIILVIFISFSSCSSEIHTEYLVIAGPGIQNDSEWNKVVLDLAEYHHAKVITYDGCLTNLLPILKKYTPRYVAMVEKPEQVGKKYIIEMNQLCRQIDDDIYADFLWGIITGYNAKAAQRMVENSKEPLVVKNAISTITELESAKWFDKYAWLDDHHEGVFGEKKFRNDSVNYHQIPLKEIKMPNGFIRKRADSQKEMQKFFEFYNTYDPDLIVTAAHATEYNLEMPFSLGNVKCKDGLLYMDFADGPKYFQKNGKRKIYLPIGNCLIGNIDNTKESMAIAWMNNANVTTFVGYVVPTWYGRNGWGGLKYWLTTPGRYSAAEAFFLNQQDMLYQLNQWSSRFSNMNFPFEDKNYMDVAKKMITDSLNKECTIDHLGFFHDRDVLAYYGDPMWNVRLQELENENDFTVNSEIINNKCVITIITKSNFSIKRMEGNHFKEEHVLELPFSYFFPKRIKNPRLAEGQNWEAAIDENFVLIYHPNFKPNSKYQVILNID